VSSGFRVSGCSRTFESTVNWRLLVDFVEEGGVQVVQAKRS
jgi:hypothetical protein